MALPEGLIGGEADRATDSKSLAVLDRPVAFRGYSEPLLAGLVSLQEPLPFTDCLALAGCGGCDANELSDQDTPL